MNPRRVLTVILIPTLLVAAIDVLVGSFAGRPMVLAAAATGVGVIVAAVVPVGMNPSPWWYAPVVDGSVLAWAAAIGVSLMWAVAS